MRWFWSFLYPYLKMNIKLPREYLLNALRREAMRRLDEVEYVLFSTQIPEEEKLPLLRKSFSKDWDKCQLNEFLPNK